MLMRFWGKQICVITILIACILASICSVSYADCDCADCGNLHNRYNQVNAVLAEICSERAALQAKGATNNPFPDSSFKKEVLPYWTGAMIAAKDSWATILPSGQTDGFCSPSYQGYDDSACLLGSLVSHETAHVATCKSVRRNRPVCVGAWSQDSFQNGYRDCMTWDEFYADEINANNAELDYLRNQINALRVSCQSAGQWCLNPDPSLAPTSCAPTVNTASSP